MLPERRPSIELNQLFPGALISCRDRDTFSAVFDGMEGETALIRDVYAFMDIKVPLTTIYARHLNPGAFMSLGFRRPENKLYWQYESEDIDQIVKIERTPEKEYILSVGKSQIYVQWAHQVQSIVFSLTDFLIVPQKPAQAEDEGDE